MRRILLISLLFPCLLAAQRIAPDQINPCSDGEILKTVSGVFSCATETGGGGGLAAVVDDATPQLGGNLDMGSFTIAGSTETELGYVAGVTSAIQTQLSSKQSTLTNSAGLAAALSDETGTGAAVFANSPVFTTPNIGSATGSVSGNAGSATALAANGSNCSAGQFPLGVSAAGASESCTALPTTISGATNEIAASASTGPVTLSLAATIDLSSKALLPPSTTVASLPAAASSTGQTFLATDGSAAGDCSTGSGSTVNLCYSNGSTWSAIGDGGGGGGGVDSGASNDVVKYTSTSTVGPVSTGTVVWDAANSLLDLASWGLQLADAACAGSSGNIVCSDPTPSTGNFKLTMMAGAGQGANDPVFEALKSDGASNIISALGGGTVNIATGTIKFTGTAMIIGSTSSIRFVEAASSGSQSFALKRIDTDTLGVCADDNCNAYNDVILNDLNFEGATVNSFYTHFSITDPTAVRAITIADADTATVQPLACSGTDKISAISAAGAITCSADEGAGSGDNVTVNSSAATDANLLDSSQVAWSLNTASSPDDITAAIVANSITSTEIDETDSYTFTTGTVSFNNDLNVDNELSINSSGDSHVYYQLQSQRGLEIETTSATGRDTNWNRYNSSGVFQEKFLTMDLDTGVVAFSDAPVITPFSTSGDLVSVGASGVLATTTPNAGTDVAADLEEEGQINATAVAGNAADDQLIVGSGAGAAAYANLPSCSTGSTDKLLYNTSTNTFSCGVDQTGGGGVTQTIQIPLTGCYYPGSDLTAGVFSYSTSSTTTPKPQIPKWLLSLSDAFECQFTAPSAYSSTPVVKVMLSAVSGTSCNAEITAQVMALSGGDSQDIDADAFASANTTGDVSMGATAGFPSLGSITMTNADSMAANDLMILLIQRTAASTGECSGDVEVGGVAFQYGS